jgi:hypothetical protein
VYVVDVDDDYITLEKKEEIYFIKIERVKEAASGRKRSRNKKRARVPNKQAKLRKQNKA